MKTLQFKTNLACSNCLAKVAPLLDAETVITSWEVDLEHEERILTIQTDDAFTPQQVEELFEEVGFEALLK